MATALEASYQSLRCLCGQGDQRERLASALRELSTTLDDDSPAFAGPGLREKWLSSRARELWLHCTDRFTIAADGEQIGSYLYRLYDEKREGGQAAIGDLVEDILGIFEHLVRDGFP